MSFTVQLTPDFIPVEPGATTPVSVVVANKSEELDRFELEIEGVDPEWTAVPVPTFPVEGLEIHSEKIFFKPSRTSESLAGNYPFVVRVRSLITGESKTVQAILQVKPFNHITMEISPKKGQYSVWRKKNDFSVIAVNLGNTEHKLQLLGNDPEDACAYEFDSEQVTVGPGQQKEVEFVANPTSTSLFAGGRLIGFSVTGRSVDHPAVVSSAQAQLEQKPVVTSASLIGAVMLAVIIGLWFLMMPKPLTIKAFSVTPQIVQRGQTVTISWLTSQADVVKVYAGTEPLYDGPLQSNTITYNLASSGDMNFRIIASKEGSEKRDDIHLNVKEPPSTPEPEVLEMQAKPDKVKLGTSFELVYKLNDSVSKAVLEPISQVLDPAVNRIEVTPTRSGDIKYAIVATNKDGTKTNRREVSVSVYEESDATIIAFTPSNVNVPLSIGKVSLSWQVNNAVRVELSADNGATQIVDPSGSQDVPVTAKTVFTLTAYDSHGRKTTQSKTVNVVQDVTPPTPPTGTTGDTGGGTTGNTTGTTTAGTTGK